MREWRRPIGQLLRGLPKLESLGGNGGALEGPKGSQIKDPAYRIEFLRCALKGFLDGKTLGLFATSFSQMGERD